MNKEKNHEVLVPWGRTALGTTCPTFTPPTNEQLAPPRNGRRPYRLRAKKGVQAPYKINPTKRTVLHLHEGKPVVFTSPYIIRLAILSVKPGTLEELVRWGEFFLEELTGGFPKTEGLEEVFFFLL